MATSGSLIKEQAFNKDHFKGGGQLLRKAIGMTTTPGW